MVDEATVVELTLLVEAQAQARQQLTDIATAAARASAVSFTEWYSSGAIGAWAEALLERVRAVQRQVAALTDAYMARAGSLVRGEPVAPVGAVDVRQLRGAVNMLQVYGRAADQFRYAVSQGVSEAEATEVAADRAATIARDDVDLAVRAQGTKSMTARPGVTGYRRVIHPELPTEASLRDGTPPPPVCGLCVAASTVLYAPREPMPIHTNCRCLPMAIYGGVDFGGAINKAALKTLYAHAGDTSREQLKRIRYVVHEHGELGPVLRLHGQAFKGPTDIPIRAAS
ncbi:MAG: hypothetical protein JWM93_103 [Frankiales bacterium]|nr:hypothetical protein [Frankiales bacterium]